MILSDILGYIGSGLLTCRYIPIIIDYYKTKSLFQYNKYLVLLELSADILLGSSAWMVDSKPMVITNGMCFIMTILLYSHNRYIKNNYNEIIFTKDNRLSEDYYNIESVYQC